MGYIGRDLVYGVFEKQVLTIVPGTHEYNLTWQAGSSTSLLVVHGGHVLEPIVDYNLNLNGKVLYFTTPPTARTYVTYLGRELEVAHAVGIQPLLNHYVATTGQTDFPVVLDESGCTIAAYPAGIIVFVDGVQKICDHDYHLDGDLVIFETAPGVGKRVDVYIHGVERFDQYGELKWVPYTLQPIALGGMSCTSSIYMAEYMAMPVKASSGSGKHQTIKLKLDFVLNLSGTPSNIIRYNLPAIGDSIDECCPAAININYYNTNILESGIQTWAGTRFFDIQRQHGINYVLGSFVRFKVRAEYDILVS